MPDLLIAAAIAAALTSAVLSYYRAGAPGRFIACLGAVAAFAFASIHAAVAPDAVGSIPLALFCGLAIVTMAAAPKRDASGKSLAGMLVVLAGTCLAYGSADLAIFTAGWGLTIAPFLAGLFEEELHGSAKAVLIASLAAVAGAAVLVEADGSPWIAFSLIVFAALLRKGIFPFHFWTATAIEHGPLLPLSLFVNSHLGALLLIRFGLLAFPDQAKDALGVMSVLALGTAILTAILGIAETSARRVLALLAISQSSFILAGLESRNPEGISGAAIHWLVVTTAVSALGIAYRLVEVRCPEAAKPNGYLGLAGRMPRLAAFFAIGGLALVGLPGTLGFVAEDLLFHGAIASSPMLGLALPAATALNAITFLRLFARIFLGRRATETPGVPDARLLERFALTACVALLVLGGLFPQIAVSARNEAAHSIARALGGMPAH